MNDTIRNKGLPRAKDTTKPRDVFAMLYLEPLERVTMALRRGDAFSPASIAQLEAMTRRFDALKAALDDRMQMIEEE